MTKITDINGAGMQPLRSVKKPLVRQSFSSSIKDAKLKQTSEEIVSALLSLIKGADEYTILLHSKMSDIVLGRIASLKASTDVSQADLLELKESISEGIQKTGLSESMKQQLALSVAAAVNATPPSDDTNKVIEELKNLDEELSKPVTEQPALEPGKPASTANEEEQLSKIEEIKDEFNLQMEKFNEIPNAVEGRLQRTFNKLNKLIASLTKKTTLPIEKNNKQIGLQINSVQESITKKTEELSKSFEDMLTTTVAGVEKKEEEALKTVVKFNPFKIFSLFGSDKDEKFEKFKRKFMPLFLTSTDKFAKNPQEFVLEVLKRNVKNIHKALRKTIASMVTTLVTKVAASVLKIMIALADFLGEAIYKIVSGIMKGLFAPFKPILIAISVALGLIMAAVIMAMFKFPELAKPIAESLAKLGILMAKVIAWLIGEVWTWMSGTLWPFLKTEVWGFLSGEFWDFIENKIFPLILEIKNWAFNVFWPFLTTLLWPWILEQVGKLVNLAINDIWPFVEETLKWLMDVIIKPVWDEFVVPVLEWVVGPLMKFVKEHVAPVILTVLEILKEFLDAIAPWIEPLFGKMMKIIDWLLKLLQKVFKILEPGIMAVVTCIKNLFVTVFNLIKDTVCGVVEFAELLFKAFKQAWNLLCDTFAGVCIHIKIPDNWRFVGGWTLFGPYYPLSGMRNLKFDMGGSGAGVSTTPPPTKGDPSLADADALDKLDNYINSAYGRIFHYLGLLAKLLGLDCSDSPALRQLGSASFFTGTKHLRKIDASARLEKYGGNPIKAVSNLIDNIARYLDLTIAPMLTKLAQCTGNADLAITVKADLTVVDKAKEAEGVKDPDEEQKSETAGFDPNEFLDELLKDDTDVKTDDESALSYLTDQVFPYMQSHLVPLISQVRDLAESVKPSNNSVVNILEDNLNDEMNYALVDQ